MMVKVTVRDRRTIRLVGASLSYGHISTFACLCLQTEFALITISFAFFQHDKWFTYENDVVI